MTIPLVKPINVKEYTSRQSKYDVVGKLPIRSILLAPSGGGKTVLLQNMILDIYKDCFERIYIFSPSINVDKTWEPVKKYIEKNIPKKLDGGDLKAYYVSSDGGVYYFSDNVALYGYKNQNAIFRYAQASPAKEARWTVALTNPTASSGNKIYTDSTDISNIQVGDIVTWSGSSGTITVTAINTATGEITLDNDNNNSTNYSVSLVNTQLTFKHSGSITVSATQEYKAAGLKSNHYRDWETDRKSVV